MRLVMKLEVAQCPRRFKSGDPRNMKRANWKALVEMKLWDAFWLAYGKAFRRKKSG